METKMKIEMKNQSLNNLPKSPIQSSVSETTSSPPLPSFPLPSSASALSPLPLF